MIFFVLRHETFTEKRARHEDIVAFLLLVTYIFLFLISGNEMNIEEV